MKVKIGNTWYDSEKEPIMVVLSDKDKNNIINMPNDSFKYCSYPRDSIESTIKKWMEIPSNE